MTRIAVLGAGTIGEALLAGLLRAGHDSTELLFTERYPQRRAEVEARYGVIAVDPATAAEQADVLVVAVKPQDIDALLDELTTVRAGAVVVSLCAGLPTVLFERRLPTGTPVVRVMPNTPMVIGEAMSALSAGLHAQEQHMELVAQLMGAVGRVVRVPESQQDAVTALSGSGPAYVFLMVEAMIDAGVHLGVPRAVAAELVTQSAVGAATMLRDTQTHPALLREAVTSPGGTTSAGVRALEEHGMRAALFAAIAAAHDRSVQLGAQRKL
jgi:pyrroline-5-carboxylate reductase